jgi:hypothetical protein
MQPNPEHAQILAQAIETNRLPLAAAYITEANLTTIINDRQEAPIHLAAKHGVLPQIASPLLNRKTLLETRDNFGWTACHWAAFYGSWEQLPPEFRTREILTGLTDVHGWTPIFLMAAYGVVNPL